MADENKIPGWRSHKSHWKCGLLEFESLFVITSHIYIYIVNFPISRLMSFLTSESISRKTSMYYVDHLAQVSPRVWREWFVILSHCLNGQGAEDFVALVRDQWHFSLLSLWACAASHFVTFHCCRGKTHWPFRAAAASFDLSVCESQYISWILGEKCWENYTHLTVASTIASVSHGSRKFVDLPLIRSVQMLQLIYCTWDSTKNQQRHGKPKFIEKRKKNSSEIIIARNLCWHFSRKRFTWRIRKRHFGSRVLQYAHRCLFPTQSFKGCPGWRTAWMIGLL